MGSHLETLLRELNSTIAGMSDEDLRAKPAGGKWSALEVMEHLYLTYTGTRKGFERVLQNGAPTTTRTTLPSRGRAFVVMGLGHIPSGRKSPESAVPKGLPQDQIINGFAAQITEMDEIVARCEERFGRRVKLLDHPFLGPLTGQQWRKFHLVHGRHHMKQIRGIKRQTKSA